MKVELNSDGVRELLKSSEMRSICQEEAEKIIKRCGDGYEANTYTGRNRVNASVVAVTSEAYWDNVNNNTVLKAIK